MSRSGAEIRCPRCGYDVRGECEGWTEACPIDGRCTECGLEFCWSDLFNRDRAPPKWSTEYVSRWGIPRAVIAGSLRMLRPRRFWKALPMHRPVHSSRLAVHVLVIALLPWALAETFRTILAAILIFEIGFSATPPTTASVPEALVIHLLLPWTPIRPGGPTTPAGSWGTPIWPTPLELRHAISRPRRSYHSYSWVPIGIQIENGRWSFGRRNPIPGPGGRVEFQTSPGVLDTSQILSLQLQRLNPRLLRHDGTVFLMTAFTALAMPLTFICLPVSLRRAKVRPVHLWRITAYSAVIPALLPIASTLFDYSVFTGIPRPGYHPFEASGICLIILVMLLALLIAWWGFALRHSLRLQSPVAVCAALSTIVLLGGGLIFVFPLATMLI